jgi:hypothetical protein
MALALESGADWEDDPVGNANSHDGRTIRRDMRDKSDSTLIAIVKRPQPQHATVENYSVGMERVTYTLGDQLELPVPETWLEPMFDPSEGPPIYEQLYPPRPRPPYPGASTKLSMPRSGSR